MNYSEEYRHQCEVRQVLQWRVQDRNKAMEYLLAVEKRRGEIPANKLRIDCQIQWSKGNRGTEGDWK